jgi:hypothetical protein
MMRERRYPTGLTTWGPLPGTGIMHILWPGPYSALFLVTGQPDAPVCKRRWGTGACPMRDGRWPVPG